MDKLGFLSQDSSDRKPGLSKLSLDCPPLPHTLFEAMAILENPGRADHGRVLRMIQNDPLVVVRLLRIVNSPYYGLSRKVESADRALRLLGPATVAGVVMGMDVVRLQAALDGPAGAVLGRLIRHALATAHMSDWLAGHVDPDGDSRDAFTAGLLHDLGRIVLVYNFPDQAAELYGSGTVQTEEEWHAAEKSAFGCSHVEAGTYLADNLDFPSALAEVVRQGGHPDNPRTIVVRAAKAAVEAQGFGFHRDLTWEECRNDDVWGFLAEAFPARAGDSEELLEIVRGRHSELSRFVFQLLVRKSDRGPRVGSRPFGRRVGVPEDRKY